jgi:hypothetical protein
VILKPNRNSIADIVKTIERLRPNDDKLREEIAALFGFTREIIPDRPRFHQTTERQPVSETPYHPPTSEISEPQRKIEDKPAPPPVSEDIPEPEKDEADEPTVIPSELVLLEEESLPANPPKGILEIEPIEKDPPVQSFTPHLMPLFPDRLIRGIISDSLSSEAETNLVDAQGVIEILAKGQPLERIPYLKHPAICRTIQVLVDVSDSMLFFNRDQEHLIEKIQKLIPKSSLEILRFENCPSRGIFDDADIEKHDYSLPPAGSLVLILSDLGIGQPHIAANRAGAKEWLNFIRRIRSGGSDALAYVPYKPKRWPKSLSKSLSMIQWDSPQSSGTYSAKPLLNLSAGIETIRELKFVTPHALELATAVSMAARIEPELIRYVRLLLLPHIGAGSEADLWFSPLVRSRSYLAMLFEPEIASYLRGRLSEDKAFMERAWDILRKFREDNHASGVIRLEEEIIHLSMYGEEQTHNIAHQLNRVLVSLMDKERVGLANWTLRAIQSFPEKIREMDVVKYLNYAARLRLSSQPHTLQTDAVNSEVTRWLLSNYIDQTRIGVLMTDEGIQFSDVPTSEMHVLEVPETEPRILDIFWQDADKKESRRISLKREGTKIFKTRATSLKIRTINGKCYKLNPAFPENELFVNQVKFDLFIGRKEELKRFEEILEPNSGIHVLNIHSDGVGGIGKTQLLIQMRNICKNISDLRCAKEIIDFYHTESRTKTGVMRQIADSLNAENFPYVGQLISEYNQATGEERKEFFSKLQDIFQEEYAKFSNQYGITVIFFDSYELIRGKDSSEYSRWLKTWLFPCLINDYTRVIIAGRYPLKDIDRLKYKVEDIRLSKFRFGDTVKFWNRYFDVTYDKLKKDILWLDKNQIKKFHWLAQGKPILLALFADWIKYENAKHSFYPEDLLNKIESETGEIGLSLSNEQTAMFEEALVSRFRHLNYPYNYIVTCMSFANRRMTPDMLEYLTRDTNISLPDPQNFLKELSSFSFVKPKQNDVFILHDEMQRLITQYWWDEQDMSRTIRKGIAEDLIKYYDGLIKRHDNAIFRAERLYYLLYADLEEGFRHFVSQFDQHIIKSYRINHCQLLLQEISRPEFYNNLSLVSQAEVDLRSADMV